MRWRQIGGPWHKRWRVCLLNERRIANMAIALRSALMTMMYNALLFAITWVVTKRLTFSSLSGWKIWEGSIFSNPLKYRLG